MTRLPLRPDLVGEQPYGAPQLDVPVRINVNENPYPVPEPVVQAITAAVSAAAKGLNRYPDRDFPALRAALARYLAAESGVELTTAQLWAANGSNEALTHVFAAFGGSNPDGTPRTVLSASPSYSMYPEYSRNALCQFVQVPRRADFSLDMPAVARAIAEHQPAIIILASPNNPTGTALELETISQVLDLARGAGPQGSDAVVVIDEAYAEFRRPGRPSALELLAANPHLVVSRTMAKAFAMAGLRLGYVAASEEIVNYLRVVRLPYHLSALTQAAALAALENSTLLQAQVAQIRSQRDMLVDTLRAWGLDVATSDTNFVLFGHFDHPHAVWEGLLERGVLIREVPVPGCLRASVGTEEENQIFLRALREVLPGLGISISGENHGQQGRE